MADNIFERERYTRATARRLENVRILLERLKVTEELSFDEISVLLKLSPSGLRKYVKDLRQSGILILARIDCVGSLTPGTAYYRLCNNKEKIKSVLARISETLADVPIAEPVQTSQARARALSTEGRQFHILRDDTEYQIRTPALKPPKHDQLLSLFYGLKDTKIPN